MHSIVLGQSGRGINGPRAMFYLDRAADTAMSFQVQCDLSVSFMEKEVFVPYMPMLE